MKLTEHFTLQEFLHSDTAIRQNINNTPAENSPVYANLEKLARTVGKTEKFVSKKTTKRNT